jgi:hypothetical protein
LIDEGGRKTAGFQEVHGGHFRLLKQIRQWSATDPPGHPQQSPPIGPCTDGSRQGRPDPTGHADGIGQDMPAAVQPHHGAGGIGAQVQCRIIQLTPGLGIGRLEHLEPMVQQVAVHLISAYAAAHAIRGFEKQDSASCSVQPPGTGQPGQSAADDDGIKMHGSAPPFIYCNLKTRCNDRRFFRNWGRPAGLSRGDIRAQAYRSGKSDGQGHHREAVLSRRTRYC